MAKGAVRGAIKRTFLRGLAALLATVITVWLLFKAYEFVSGSVGGAIAGLLGKTLSWYRGEGFELVEAPGEALQALGTALALFLAFLVALFVGFFLASFVGRKVWGAAESKLFSFPVVRSIYPSLKQITDSVFGEKRLSFRKVVLVEYPRKGVYSIAFLTGDAFESLQKHTGIDMVTLFVPSSPTPFTGYCLQVPWDEVVETDISVDAAIRYTVSGGVILPLAEGGAPEHIQKRKRERPGLEGPPRRAHPDKQE